MPGHMNNKLTWRKMSIIKKLLIIIIWFFLAENQRNTFLNAYIYLFSLLSDYTVIPYSSLEF